MNKDALGFLQWLAIPAAIVAARLWIATTKARREAGFRIRVTHGASKGDPAVRILRVEATGRFSTQSGRSFDYIIVARDVTDPRMPRSVHSTTPGFTTGPEHWLLEVRVEGFPLKPGRVVADWTEIASIPVADIWCAHAGSRTLEFQVMVAERPDMVGPQSWRQIAAKASAHATVETTRPGYLEPPGDEPPRPDLNPGTSHLN